MLSRAFVLHFNVNTSKFCLNKRLSTGEKPRFNRLCLRAKPAKNALLQYWAAWNRLYLDGRVSVKRKPCKAKPQLTWLCLVLPSLMFGRAAMRWKYTVTKSDPKPQIGGFVSSLLLGITILYKSCRISGNSGTFFSWCALGEIYEKYTGKSTLKFGITR